MKSRFIFTCILFLSLLLYAFSAIQAEKKPKFHSRMIGIAGVDSIMKRDKISTADSHYLSVLEDSVLNALAVLQVMDTAHSWHAKSSADRQLIIALNKALQVPYAFAYPFSKLHEHISIVYPEDSTFRILTWQYSIDDMTAMKQGVLQLNTADGTPKFFPLLDRARQMQQPLDTVTGTNRWVGAMYYQVLTHNVGRRRIYTLLGIDEHTLLSTRKWIEILRFSKEGIPYFGGNFFSFAQAPAFLKNDPIPTSRKTDQKKKERRKKDPDQDKIPLHLSPAQEDAPIIKAPPIQYKRFMIEYDKHTIANLRYDESLGMIIFDHLAPADDATLEKKYTYSIDGDYSGFVWQKGKWTYIPQVFSYSSEQTGAPIDKPRSFKKEEKFYEQIRR